MACRYKGLYRVAPDLMTGTGAAQTVARRDYCLTSPWRVAQAAIWARVAKSSRERILAT